MKYPPQGLARIGQWKNRFRRFRSWQLAVLRPIGSPVLQAGADSARVVTDVPTHADPESRSKEWLRATETVSQKT